MNPFIYLDKKILNWQWYTDIPTKVLFIHMLLKANWTEGKFKGVTIKRGQLPTSLNHLATETGLSVRQVRTCLRKLNNTKEVTSKTTNKYTIITICNYEAYQYKDYENDTQNDKQMTNKRQTNDNNIKNIRIKEYKNKNKKEHFIQIFIKKNCPNISKLITNQLTVSECESLEKKYSWDLIKENLMNMENKPDKIKGNSSVNLTIQTWQRNAEKWNAKRQKIDFKKLSNQFNANT